MTDSKRITFIPQVIAIIMLAWALVPVNPYGYYILLRIVICGICCFLAYNTYELEESKKIRSSGQAWVWVLGIVAIIYNPIIRIHLDRGIWSVINVVTIALMIVMLFVLNPLLNESDSDEADADTN